MEDGWRLAYAHVVNDTVYASLYRRKEDGGTS
jgi:hypothetical protein